MFSFFALCFEKINVEVSTRNISGFPLSQIRRNRLVLAVNKSKYNFLSYTEKVLKICTLVHHQGLIKITGIFWQKILILYNKNDSKITLRCPDVFIYTGTGKYSFEKYNSVCSIPIESVIYSNILKDTGRLF